MGERYVVEERVGCVAVRDTLVHDNGTGLHSDTPGVVWFKFGKRIVDVCDTCGSKLGMGWEVPKEDVREAHEIAKTLNSGGELPKGGE